MKQVSPSHDAARRSAGGAQRFAGGEGRQSVCARYGAAGSGGKFGFAGSSRRVRCSAARFVRRLRFEQLVQLAPQPSDVAAQLQRTAGAFAAPERDFAEAIGRFGDVHAVGLNALNAPRRCAELEHVADLGFVNVLFVQLAEVDAGFMVMHRIGGALRDRARSEKGRHGSRRQPLEAAAGAVPGDERAHERVMAGEHVQHRRQLLARQAAVAVAARQQPLEPRHVPSVACRQHGDDMLREDIEPLPRHAERLDV
ncbi:hypothetical protein SD70_24540, partial [Gordoniibacillus kamchatkensis]